MRDGGLPEGVSPQMLFMMTGMTPEQLKGGNGANERLDIEIYASPYYKVDAPTGRYTAEEQRKYAQILEARLAAKLRSTDRAEWKAAVDAPVCKACGWEAMQVL
jgi:hypothetical protein